MQTADAGMRRETTHPEFAKGRGVMPDEEVCTANFMELKATLTFSLASTTSQLTPLFKPPTTYIPRTGQDSTAPHVQDEP